MSCRSRLEFPSDNDGPNEKSKDLIVRAIFTAAAAAAAADTDIHWSFELPKRKMRTVSLAFYFGMWAMEGLQASKRFKYYSEECLQRYGWQRTVYL